jgi:hypothetical protein
MPCWLVFVDLCGFDPGLTPTGRVTHSEQHAGEPPLYYDLMFLQKLSKSTALLGVSLFGFAVAGTAAGAVAIADRVARAKDWSREACDEETAPHYWRV